METKFIDLPFFENQKNEYDELKKEVEQMYEARNIFLEEYLIKSLQKEIDELKKITTAGLDKSITKLKGELKQLKAKK